MYFSAYWSPPDKAFTPTLVRAYGSYKRTDVAVVFVSYDKDQADFDKYFGEMPWLALPFTARDVKEALVAKVQVSGEKKIGVPTLLVFRPDGTVANNNGRQLIPEGADLETALTSWGFK